MPDWAGLEAAKLVAVDTETSGLHPDDGARVACVAVAWQGGSLALPFDQGIRDKIKRAGEGQLELAFAKALQDDPNADENEWCRLFHQLESKLIVMHNAKFDLTMLRAGTRHYQGYDLSANLVWDTMLASRVLEPLESAGLDRAAKRAGYDGKEGLDVVVAWLKRNKLPVKRYDLAPWELVEKYVTSDAELTIALWKHQQDWIHNEGDHNDKVWDEIHREVQLAVTLYKMEGRGVGYDREKSLEVAEDLTARADDIESTMPFRASVNEAKRYFFVEQGLESDRPTPKGKPSLDEEQVRDWTSQGVEWAQEYRDVTRARRAVSMWYQGYVDKLGEDGRLRASYRHGTVTSGRLSVERVQLQAMPKADKIEEGVVGVRDLLRAKKGYGLWSLDMQQAELRVAAHYSGCARLLEMLAEGRDVHGETTQQVLGVQPDAPDYKLKRDIGKRLTFSSLFGIGGKHFHEILKKMADIDLPISECDILVKRWRDMYPEITHAYRKCDRHMQERGWVRILPGTEYETKSWLAPHEYPNTGWNRMVQGSLAAWLRMWLVAVDEEWPDTLVLTVHDSIALELPKKTGARIAKEVAEFSAERATALFGIPMPVEVDRYA